MSDNVDPKIEQLALSHSAQAMKQLLADHPELANIPSRQIALIFHAGIVLGADLMRQVSQG